MVLCFCGQANAQVKQGWPSEDPPRPLKARDVKFPPYEMQSLPNGLQVIAVMHHEQPAISMRLLVRAGSAVDQKDKLGLAHLTSALLTQGTTSKSAEELADQIDFIGGAMGSGAGTDLSYINMVVMKDSFDVGLAMLSDMARHPAFAPAEIDRQRQQVLSGLQVSLHDPDYVANAVFDRLVYGFHPYGMPQTGTPETISGLTRQDLVAFHGRYFVPNNAILAIVGDTTADEAFAAAKRAFGDWERKDVAPARFTEPPDPTRRLVVINKPDAVQTEVRVGHIGVPRKSEDYMALNLAIRILGGEGSNRLHQVLRTERGLTYGAQADFDTLKEAGDVEAQTNTRSEATGEVLRLIVDQFWRLQRERVGDRELEGAKAYLTGSFPLTIETPDQIAMQVLNHVFYDLPLTQLQNFRERVNAVTPDDIQRVARVYLKPDRLSVVLVGNATAFTSQLKGVGFGNFEVIDLDNLDLTAGNFKHEPTRTGRADGVPANRWASGFSRIGGLDSFSHASYSPSSQQSTAPKPTPPQAGGEEGGRVKALLDQAIAAKGGLDKLQSIKSLRVVTTTTMEGPQGTREAQATTYFEYPNRVRLEGKQGTVEIVQVFDGQHLWMKSPRGVEDAPAPVENDFAMSVKRDVVSLLLAAHDGKVQTRALPDVRDAAGAVRHALEFSGADLQPTILHIDPDTGLIAKQSYVLNVPGQPLVEESFSDYRPVDGVQFAWVATVTGPQQRTITRKITDIKINVPVDPGLFKRPTS